MSERCPELAGYTEAAGIYGVRKSNLRQVRGLPEPVQVLRCGSIWRRDELEDHARRRAERNGEETER